MRILRIAIAAACVGAPIATIAAQAAACFTGPGSAFGITSYECASCGTSYYGGKAVYSFRAEPTVVESNGAFRQSDVIEAIDGKPITSVDGAAAFAYPYVGDHVVTVRRNGKRVEVPSRVTCASFLGLATPEISRLAIPVDREREARLKELLDAVPADSVRRERINELARSNNFRFTRTPLASPRPAGLHLGPPAASLPEVTMGAKGRFGLALSCATKCSMEQAIDGTIYWKHEGNPPIMGIRPDSPAERAGLKVGDVVTKIDGYPIVDKRATLALLQSERASILKVTVLRAGDLIEYLLQYR